VLTEQDRALGTETVGSEPFVEALDSVNYTKGSVDQWWQDWSAHTSNLKTSRSVPLSVFRGCLPLMICALDVFSQSRAIFALSPELEGGDRNLVGKGIRAVKWSHRSLCSSWRTH
jgi:hypothetical protein